MSKSASVGRRWLQFMWALYENNNRHLFSERSNPSLWILFCKPPTYYSWLALHSWAALKKKKKKSHLELIDEDEADHFVAEQKQLFVAAYKHQHKPLLECIAITKKKT